MAAPESSPSWADIFADIRKLNSEPPLTTDHIHRQADLSGSIAADIRLKVTEELRKALERKP